MKKFINKIEVPNFQAKPLVAEEKSRIVIPKLFGDSKFANRRRKKNIKPIRKDKLISEGKGQFLSRVGPEKEKVIIAQYRLIKRSLSKLTTPEKRMIKAYVKQYKEFLDLTKLKKE